MLRRRPGRPARAGSKEMTLGTGKTAVLLISLVIFANFGAVYPQSASIYRLPAGTRMKLMLDAGLTSRSAGVNDTFLASLSESVRVRDVVVLPAGTIVEGRVTKARAARSGRGGELEFVFETLLFSPDNRRPIDAVLVNELRSKSGRTFTFLSIFGGSAAGTVIGGIGKGGVGAAIGAGIGAGVGTGIALTRKGPEIKVERNTEFEVVLRKELVLPVQDY